MTTSIDAAGRLVLPKAVREAAGLTPGMPLDVSWRDGRIEIVPIFPAPQLIDRGGILVAEVSGEARLTTEDVERLRATLRNERPG